MGYRVPSIRYLVRGILYPIEHECSLSVLDNDYTHKEFYKKLITSYNMVFSRILLTEYYFWHYA
jgi:hypothetical protein